MPTLLPGVNMTSSPAGVIVRNSSAAAQTPAAATLTQIVGSLLRVPQGGLKVGTTLKWKFNMTKTAAGTATSQFDIAVGTLGTVADTARVSFTKPAGTAAADEAWVEVTAVVRSVSATGVIVGNFLLSHNLAATGHAQIPQVSVKTVSAGFDNRGEELYISLNITSGASDAITIDQVEAELQRPA
jgi:hypothetical protein